MKLAWKMLPILFAMLLITGCAQKLPDDQMQSINAGVNSATGSNESGSNESGSNESGSNETQATSEVQEDNTGSGEEKAYILTFEAGTIEGETITSECFADSKLTMLNVWATYCNPCLSEMPDLGEIAASYDTADFQMIGIISDVSDGAGEDEIANAKSLIADTNANYPHLLLNQSLYENLVGAVEAVPTTFFVNQKGEVLGYVMGAQSKETWEEIINDLLAENE